LFGCEQGDEEVRRPGWVYAVGALVFVASLLLPSSW
jgi:hypothetical protein